MASDAPQPASGNGDVVWPAATARARRPASVQTDNFAQWTDGGFLSPGTDVRTDHAAVQHRMSKRAALVGLGIQWSRFPSFTRVA